MSRDRCAAAQCPYGLVRYMDDRSGCEECYCDDPCSGHVCKPGTKCQIELYRDQNQQTAYR